MNFYKHHIGDYDQATRHLSFVEDAAYSRLIRKYYAEEKPLPADLKQVQRLIGARARDEKEAVETILGEFFVLEEDGWHNKRCDEELAKANKQAETNRQIALEREAKKRARMEHESNTNRGEEKHESCSDVDHDSCSSREPSQTPDTINNYPHTPKGAKNPTDEKAGKPKRSAIGLLSYLQSCKQSGRKPIAEDDGVFAYAEQVGIPIEFLRLHWLEFKARYGLPDAKRYKDWPTVHRKSVRGNWFRLWFIDAQGSVMLTTVGEQAKRVHGEAA